MSCSSTIIPTAEVVAGMVIACDIRDANGAVMIAGGTELNRRLIEVLKLRQVAEVEVLAQEDASQRQSRRDKALAKLSQQFGVYAEDPVMQQLLALLERYHTRGLN